MAFLPKYKAVPVPGRFLVTRVLITIIIGIIVYIIFYANYFIYSEKVPVFWDWIMIILLLLAIIIEAVYSYVKYSQYQFFLYDSMLQLKAGKTVDIKYGDIKNILLKENILDKPFGTGTIILELKDSVFRIEHIAHASQLFYMLQKMK